MKATMSLLSSPRLAIATILSLCGACTALDADKGETGSWSPGKADGSFEVRDLGPLFDALDAPVELAGYVPAFRIESFGNTTLDLGLRGLDGADAYLVVEGPLGPNGDAIAPGLGAVVDSDDDGGAGYDSRLEVVLAEPGVYRVIAGTFDSLALGYAPTGDRLELSASCTANCDRPAISAREFLTLMRDSGQLDRFAALAEAKLAELVPDEEMRTGLVNRLREMVASSDFEGIERFPTIPLQAVGELRPALGMLNSPPPAETEVVTGDLLALLGACDAERKMPPPAHPSIPEVGNGHFPNRTLNRCQASHSATLAHVLTALASQNGSAVEYEGQTITTPRELFAALMRSGHTIEVRNERTYANFISLTLGETDVRWPVWIDTGVALATGEHITVPVGHSHHAWRIRGPKVDARVMFYLGISGAAFFGQTQVRPGWTGEAVRDIAKSDAGGEDLILSTVEYATYYLRRIRVERATVAAGMPADGYGYLGVCNDSNATVELATRGTITTFPLMRAASLDGHPQNDELDDLIRALPHDADGIVDRTDAMRRILDMTPHELDSPRIWDEALRTQLEEAAAELGR